MTIVFYILGVLVEIYVFLYILVDICLSIVKKKYQELWNKEKAMRMRIDPDISRAKLCEYYVMFCKRNDCKVDF